LQVKKKAGGVDKRTEEGGKKRRANTRGWGEGETGRGRLKGEKTDKKEKR